MIKQYELPGLLRQEMPAMAMHLNACQPSLEIYVFVNEFVKYTRHAIEDHNFELAKKSFNLADKIYCNGDRQVKVLIENSFVYSMSSFMPAGLQERHRIRAIIPNRLYSLYLKQIMQSGC